GGELFQRDDDKEEVIRHRLEGYSSQTSPLIAFYADEGILVGIDATGPGEEGTAPAPSAPGPYVPRAASVRADAPLPMVGATRCGGYLCTRRSSHAAAERTGDSGQIARADCPHVRGGPGGRPYPLGAQGGRATGGHDGGARRYRRARDP